MKRLLSACLLICLALQLSRVQPAVAEGWLPDLNGELPVISIVTDDLSYVTGPTRETKLQGGISYVDATVSVSGCDPEDVIDAAPAQVKARGNYTLEYPKKSIRIKFSQKQGMLGLHDGAEYRSWVLLAEWKDLSMLHSPVGYYLSHAILGSDGYYVADCRNVEVWLNGEYWGVYLLTEQQEVKDGRTRLPEVGKDESGTDVGYFFEYDAYFAEEKNAPDGDPVFEVYHSGTAQEQYGYTIKSDIRSDRQRRFLAGYVRRAHQIFYEAVVNGRSFAMNAAGTSVVPADGLTPQQAAGSVVDLRSLTDMYILHELTRNPDVGWSSFYITLDMSDGGNGLLTFEAPWDFDSAFGIRADYESAEGWYVQHSGNPWLSLAARAEWFQAMVRERWAELREAGMPEQALALIGAHQAALADAYARNYERWPERIRDGNHELIDELNACTSQQEAADYLHRWLSARVAWLDGMWSR